MFGVYMKDRKHEEKHREKGITEEKRKREDQK